MLFSEYEEMKNIFLSNLKLLKLFVGFFHANATFLALVWLKKS